MLSYDSLILHSKERGLPSGKLRGAAREYAQLLALKALYHLPGARELLFLGGTALRLGHNLSRFSEDLDFDTSSLSFRDWKALLEETAHNLSKQGFLVEGKASEKGSLLGGDLRCQNFLQTYRLTADPNEKLRIKLEANRPGYPIVTEPRVLSGYGELFAVPFAGPGLVAAEKILCLLNRELGRDVYDLFFIAGKKWKPDRRVLQARGIQGDLVKIILERINSWGPKRLETMARRLEPFLFDPDQAKLVKDAQTLLPASLEYLTI